MADKTLVERLRDFAAHIHEEFSRGGVETMMYEAANRIEYLESVAGPVSKATAFDKAREPVTHE
jgi:hypothetical protein